jgi:hypothetical protein
MRLRNVIGLALVGVVSPQTPLKSLQLGNMVVCAPMTRAVDRSVLKKAPIDRAAFVGAVRSLRTEFNGRAVRLLSGSIDSDAELLLSKPDSADVFAIVSSKAGTSDVTSTTASGTPLYLRAWDLCRWRFASSVGVRASADVTLITKLKRSTKVIEFEVLLECGSATRVEARYDGNTLKLLFEDQPPPDGSIDGATPIVCVPLTIQTKVRLTKPLGTTKLVVLGIFDPTWLSMSISTISTDIVNEGVWAMGTQEARRLITCVVPATPTRWLLRLGSSTTPKGEPN